MLEWDTLQRYSLSATVANPITLAHSWRAAVVVFETSIQSTLFKYPLILLNTAHNTFLTFATLGMTLFYCLTHLRPKFAQTDWICCFILHCFVFFIIIKLEKSINNMKEGKTNAFALAN